MFSFIFLPAFFALQMLPQEKLGCVPALRNEWFLVEKKEPQALLPISTEPLPPFRSLEWLFGEVPVFHFSDQYHQWSAGAFSSEYLAGIYLKTPVKICRELDYIFFLRALFNSALGRIDGIRRTSWISGKQFAYVLHTEHAGINEGAYWAIDGAKFTAVQNELSPRLKNLPNQFFKIVEKNYRDRLDLKEKDIAKLIRISRRMLSRSILLLKTKESFMALGGPEQASELAQTDLNVEAGMILTWSTSADELLPMEAFNGERIPRLKEIAAEVGRFVVERGRVRDLSLREMQAAAVTMVGLGIREAKCEADFRRAPLFLDKGMSVQKERLARYSGQKEFILTGDPEVLTHRTVHEFKFPLYELDQTQKALMYQLSRELGLIR